MMSRFKLVALSNAVDGADAELLQWYRETHLNDVSAVPGVTGASFLQFSAGNDRWRYLAIYDVDADDPTTVMAEIKRRSGSELMRSSPALNIEDLFFGAFSYSSMTD